MRPGARSQEPFHHPEVLNPPISQTCTAPQPGFHQLNSMEHKSKLQLFCFANLNQRALSNASWLKGSGAVNTSQQSVQKGPGQRRWLLWCSYQLGKARYPLWWLKQAANYSWGQALFSVGECLCQRRMTFVFTQTICKSTQKFKNTSGNSFSFSPKHWIVSFQPLGGKPAQFLTSRWSFTHWFAYT